MNPVDVEQQLREAFAAVRATVHENDDLFARVTRTLDDDRARRRFRLRLAAGLAGYVLANTGLAFALAATDSGRSTMPWWVIELVVDILLVALMVGLGPFIKRFGRAYAADVFRATPRTGKSYLVLTDVAYYLIFSAYVLFTVQFVEPPDWKDSVATQLQSEAGRVGGMLLLMGILHGLNVVALPVVGRLLRMGPSGSSPSGRSVLDLDD